MSNTPISTAQILPLPMVTAARLRGVETQIHALIHELDTIRAAYTELHRNPAVVAVDQVGDALAPTTATFEVCCQLDAADRTLRRAVVDITRAYPYSSRLKLTAAAARRRELALTARRRARTIAAH
ncbi:hypothetical protein [Nocardia cyriacigeorgica]|uniref:hypothetical protein n=1 Tax=Nocardia cyriacigeorgica TaxID=135487 RepID=UPI002456C113|nr:hypothetical protein [Nocardia cyriacigeorgica]